MSATDHADLISHYADEGLLSRIDQALLSSGFDLAKLDAETASRFDQFHLRGLPATLELLDLAKFPSNPKLLDVGSGLGGPARTLALQSDAIVTGLDLTPEFVQVSNVLTERLGLQSRCEFVVGSALDMPFDDASFDGAWMQHVNMNIPDKNQLFTEIHRVLRPNGKLALHEILRSGQRGPTFPVPWASNPEQSFLTNADSLREAFGNAGFEIQHWDDETSQVIPWLDGIVGKMRREGIPTLGLTLLMGPSILTKLGNLLDAFQQGRLSVVMAVAKRSN